MPQPIYHVDAFVGQGCRGNPAGVVLLEFWPADDLLHAIAEENLLPETAFVVPEANRGEYALRWFSPRAEVPLCGHATLATAFVLFHETGVEGDRLRFSTLSGPLVAFREGEDIGLDLPTASLRPLPPTPALRPYLGGEPEAFYAYGDDALVVVVDEDAVRASRAPDEQVLATLGLRGLCVSARGKEFDIVSRFFAPPLGIPEDPVTGSAHCALAPYWGKRLGRKSLTARQLSERGGVLRCRWEEERVRIAGRGRLYLRGTIESPLPGRDFHVLP
jgi:predicted PhzF superfamily epimerase YddE/YHI9